MPGPIQITYHHTPGEVWEAWRSLVRDGGYELYVSADVEFHALKLASMGIQ